ncbi:MAG: sigma-54-dependent Fis family transcriptional regulator [Candidatus Magnetomorum sp.]|nr:sigma-54-dependent Fis family transcriptional regulator [Candidatus Magnetomorum sp.]
MIDIFLNSDFYSRRMRLFDLKARLEKVASAWTVSDYKSLLMFYVNFLPKIMDAERCTIYINEMETEIIWSIYGTQLNNQKIKPPKDKSIVGKVIGSGEAAVENHLEDREGFHKKIDSITGFQTRNMVCAPIQSLTGHGVTGAVQILNKKEDADFNQFDMDRLNEIAGYLSISIESILLNGEILKISKQLNEEIQSLDESYFSEIPFVANSPVMQKLLEQVRMLWETPVNVLIQGENGTGKELIARMIHEGYSESARPFVAVNCASIPETLMESEFFGHEKGAFSGAINSKKGLFEEADGGTLFLDEIGDLPLTMQPKFLRAIQEGEGYRVGSNKLSKFQFRVICASNKNLKEMVTNGEFREDLYFRLFSVEILLPTLRERKEDIIPLAMSFLDDVCKNFKKTIDGISPEVFKLFEQYDWPGNVRQLKREIERLVALTPQGEEITSDKCSKDLISPQSDRLMVPGDPFSKSLQDHVKDLEIHLIEQALEKSNGSKSKASDLLGITRQGLHKKLIRYEMEKN